MLNWESDREPSFRVSRLVFMSIIQDRNSEALDRLAIRKLGRREPGGPEVRLGAMTGPSRNLQSEVVVHRLAKFLFAAQIALSGLDR